MRKNYPYLLAILCLSLLPLSLQAKDNAHWGYHGDIGPANWGKLGFPICAKGKNQSPVNITGSAPANIDPIQFNYRPTALRAINNGHTVQFNYRTSSSITIAGKQYQLLQFHLHAPSEHTINGKAFPLEAHLVHKSHDGRLAVIGVFFTGEETQNSHDNETINTVFGALPGVAKLNLESKTTINAADLLPEDKSYHHFLGSLTTPPCSEGVSWFVMRTPVTISNKQITRFKTIFDNNARPTQPWNRRIPLQKVGGEGHAPASNHGGGHGDNYSGGHGDSHGDSHGSGH
ncbi:carbonic anhydrase [Magnetococcales bacterium HHB-1]